MWDVRGGRDVEFIGTVCKVKAILLESVEMGEMASADEGLTGAGCAWSAWGVIVGIGGERGVGVVGFVV